MLKTEISNKTLVNSKINTASNVFNIISSVILFVIFASTLIMMTMIKNQQISGNISGNKKEDLDIINLAVSFVTSILQIVLKYVCYFIPLLLSITLKFVFGIINGRNMSKSKILKNGLLFLILNIVALTLSILLIIIDMRNIFIKENNIITFNTFNKYLYFIISLICLICAIFTIVDRIRKNIKFIYSF